MHELNFIILSLFLCISYAMSSYPIVGPEALMSAKAHGTCLQPVQRHLRYNCDVETADRICCFNRHYAEHSGYFTSTSFLSTVDPDTETTYYDSVTGKPLFIAPRGRSFDEFVSESRKHGWPSFRDEEVVWENMRCLSGGEAVSVDGTHLGHNLPDHSGNRYCINLVSVAGSPPSDGGGEDCSTTDQSSMAKPFTLEDLNRWTADAGMNLNEPAAKAGVVAKRNVTVEDLVGNDNEGKVDYQTGHDSSKNNAYDSKKQNGQRLGYGAKKRVKP